MADGKQGMVTQNTGQKIQLKMKELEIELKKLGQDPVGELKIKLKELEAGYRGWLEKQSLLVETAVVSTTSAAQGAAIGSFMGVLTGDYANLNPPPNLNPQAMASLQQAQALSGGPMVQARNFAVMTGVNAGITCVMKRIRGKEDIQTNMVAAFGSGAMFSVVSGLGGPNQAVNAVTSGLFFALIQGGIFKIQEKLKQPPGKDVEAAQMYDKTTNLLTSLGLERYEKNFKKGLLTDTTLPLLNDRDPELKERRG